MNDLPMQQHRKTLQTMTISEVKSRLSSLVNEISESGTRIVVEKSGIPVAAVIPIADLRRLIRLDELDDEAREILDAMRAAFRDVPSDEIERQTERIMSEIWAENRDDRERAARSA